MRSEDLVVMGYVRGSFGVRGWIRLHTDTEYADSLFDYDTWWLGKDGHWTPYTFEEGQVQAKGVVARLKEVSDRDIAHQLRGMEIAVPRSLLPAPDSDEYYWTDLIGLTVVNQDGQSLGKVKNLMETGAHDILVIRSDSGEVLVPFVDEIVLEVNPAEQKIVVDWGLDY